MKVPECLTKVSDYAKTAAASVSKQLSRAGESVKQLARKVAETTAPMFQKIKAFAIQNKGPLTVGVICLAIGALIATAISRLWKSNSNPGPIPNPSLVRP
jgi:hypothetical protein